MSDNEYHLHPVSPRRIDSRDRCPNAVKECCGRPAVCAVSGGECGDPHGPCTMRPKEQIIYKPSPVTATS